MTAQIEARIWQRHVRVLLVEAVWRLEGFVWRPSFERLTTALTTPRSPMNHERLWLQRFSPWGQASKTRS
jgi:hypothetical protein